MAPSATEAQSAPELNPIEVNDKAGVKLQEKWVKSTGVLDQFESFDVTPVIGREFPNVNLVEWLQASNANELLRELALTISQRGVVFFRAQDDLTPELQKDLVQRIGLLSGKPPTSGLHIHPLLNPEREGYRVTDPEISTIDSELNKKLYSNTRFDRANDLQNTSKWHSDIAFEPKPADYSSLKLEILPKTGGDTLWASGYEIYDRISEPYQRFLETLTVTFQQPGFIEAAKNGGFELYDKPRGAPENVGRELKAVHPVVRTNPVSGWKSLFPVGGHVSHINDITSLEGKALLEWFKRLLLDNHDLQVRFKWKNQNDLAIWDNRSTFHTATDDLDGQGERYGVRAVSVGEKPFLDHESKSRREALGI
ncbi:putative Alpha-ketoglutarate-dependent taurine dioxygenase [Sclerotinia borealis F-4128]|uniref:Putative Alpha-ketoglutarate-dependent taurine dioxygenase n=1 Tax=Sclerotinia borealis (strain F-4128) TaxID=1432307 RepID=W9C3Q1_SCLBF|nr:putative Alpha-ketoglutarate-dependent taurine dioxygenase [Sclerotinia borealis F-4128]